jgi:DNA-binding IclR family transcriptional regulator
VSVFRFLAQHPREGFTLSELARRLDLNKATCHAMFTAMETHGLLLRHPVTKAYTLGPALIGLAEAVAPSEYHALEMARAKMDELSEDLGLAAIVSGRVGDEMVVLARRLPPGYVPPSGRPPTIGTRSAWAPPIGAIFTAWADESVQRAWLDRTDETHRGERREHYEARLEEIRQRGYEVGLVHDSRSRLLRAVRNADEAANPQELRQLVMDLLDHLQDDDGVAASGAGGKQMLYSITAPVFGSGGDVVISITIDGFSKPLGRREIERYGNRLAHSADQVTRAIHGQFPTGWPAAKSVPAKSVPAKSGTAKR